MANRGWEEEKEKKQKMLALRVSPNLFSRIVELIEKGYFSSISDFTRTAIIIFLFIFEQIQKGKKVVVEPNRGDVMEIGNFILIASKEEETIIAAPEKETG